MSEAKKERCCERVQSNFNFYQCSNRASVMRDGKHYCGRHDPVAVAERKKKQFAKWDTKNNAVNEIYRRRAACVNACEGISTEALEAGIVKKLLAVCRRAQQVLAALYIHEQTIDAESFDFTKQLDDVIAEAEK